MPEFKFTSKSVTVIGLGSIGLPYARYLAWSGHEVHGYDTDVSRIAHLKDTSSFDRRDTNVPLTLRVNTPYPRIIFDSALTHTDYYLVCVPTPALDGYSLDTSAVLSAVGLALELNPRSCVILKSTVTLECLLLLENRHPGASIVVAPEYLREGETEADLFKAPTLVLGTSSLQDFDSALALLYASTCVFRKTQVLQVSRKEAVYSKVLHNAYLAMRVAFFNEVDSVCAELGLDARNVIDTVSSDPRIGRGYNNPSFGFGGTCLPKDLKYAESLHEDALGSPSLLEAVTISNVARQRYLVRLLDSKFPGKQLDVGVVDFHPSPLSPKVELSSTEAVVLRLLRAGKVRTLKVFSSDGTYAGVPESLLDTPELTLVTSQAELSTCDVVLCDKRTWMAPDLPNLFTRDLGRGN